jgi:hypothetical protein
MTATQQLPASEVLRLALEKLGPNGENWIKGALYTAADGFVDCDVTEAANFCSLGAIEAASGTTDIRKAEKYLSSAIHGWSWVDNWNDAEERTFPEVKAAFEKAISLAKEDEASGRQ